MSFDLYKSDPPISLPSAAGLAEQPLLPIDLAGRDTEEEDRQIDEKLLKELDEAVGFALNSPDPEIEEACTDVYCESL